MSYTCAEASRPFCPTQAQSLEPPFVVQMCKILNFGYFDLEMDEFAGINFLCVMEGQNYEQALSKIVSKSFFPF